MKRYKLLKDTPAFKAGTKCYIEEAGNMVPCRGISYTIVHKDQLEKNPNILTDWFEEIKEPLIKDEKIRKAILAWAEANEIETVEYDEYWVSFRRDDKTISFKDEDRCLGFHGLENSRDYTIDELCGEEEE